MVKTTKKQIEMMKKLRAKGFLYSQIAEKLGITIDKVSYYLNATTRANKIKDGKKRAKENPERHRLWNKRWRRDNPEKYKKSIFFSTMRSYLKRGIITKKEVLDTMGNYTVK